MAGDSPFCAGSFKDSRWSVCQQWLQCQCLRNISDISSQTDDTHLDIPTYTYIYLHQTDGTHLHQFEFWKPQSLVSPIDQSPGPALAAGFRSSFGPEHRTFPLGLSLLLTKLGPRSYDMILGETLLPCLGGVDHFEPKAD